MSVPLLDEAFLPEHRNLFAIIEISAAGIAIIIQLCIGTLAYSKLRRSECTTSRELVILFCLSLIFALLFLSTETAVNVFYLLYGSNPTIEFIDYVNGSLFFFFLLMILCTLVTRLYVTFKDSALRMSKSTLYLFIMLFVSLFILTILTFIGFTLAEFDITDHGTNLFLFSGVLSLILYIAGCAFAVTAFALNLWATAKLQVNSQRDVSVNPEDISFNNMQLSLLHLSAKYILLFLVTILSTGLASFCVFIVSHELGGVFCSFDVCVNSLCIYLQFAFAANHYRKCCGCLDSRCRAVELKRAKTIIHKDSLSRQKSEEGTESRKI